MRGRNFIIALIILIVLLGALAWYYRDSAWLAPLLGRSSAPQQLVTTAMYACDGGKTISASYYQGPQNPPATNGMPQPSGSVKLVLSDGRSLTLPQTVSASGIRYTAPGNSLVFWSKGNTAFITEGSPPVFSYKGCIVGSNISGQEAWGLYASSTMGISVKYPQGYAPYANYVYQGLGPGKNIAGVSFTVPPSYSQGTNLGSDSAVSVEEIAKTPASGCTADLFLDLPTGVTAAALTDNGATYSFASTTGAGAGNRYEEDVYAIPGTMPCIAVRYLIHYGVLDNYPAGTITPYNRASLLSDFDSIRRSLIIGTESGAQ